MIDVLSEFIAYAAAVQPAHRDRLAGLGVPLETLHGVDPLGANFGACRIRPLHDGRWQPDDQGRAAVVVPIGWRDVLWSSMFDLAAFFSYEPDRWWLRQRCVDVLGADNIEAARERVSTIAAHATPLDWLRASCRGFVVLDWDSFDPAYDLVGVRIQAPADLRERIRERATSLALADLHFSDCGMVDEAA